MTANAHRTEPQGSEERKALEQSERKASVDQPGSFSDKALDEKIVEIPPVEKDDAPIKGLDPKPPA